MYSRAVIKKSKSPLMDVTVLRNLAKSCNFRECMRDTLIRDRIVLGVNNNALRKKLLQVGKLTLNQFIDIGRSTEVTTSQMKAISGVDRVHRVREGSRSVNKPLTKRKNDRNVPDNLRGRPHKKCLFCGGERVLQRDKCPAWGQKCLECGGQNHFKSVCKKAISTRVHDISQRPDELSSEESDVELLAGVAIDSQECDIHTVGYAKEIHAEMLIDDRKVGFQIDCGASINKNMLKVTTSRRLRKLFAC